MAEPTYEELKARLAELESKQQRGGGISFKVSDKQERRKVVGMSEGTPLKIDEKSTISLIGLGG